MLVLQCMVEDRHLANDRVLSTLTYDSQIHHLTHFIEAQQENKIYHNLVKEDQTLATFRNKRTKLVTLTIFILDLQRTYENNSLNKIKMRKVR